MGMSCSQCFAQAACKNKGCSDLPNRYLGLILALLINLSIGYKPDLQTGMERSTFNSYKLISFTFCVSAIRHSSGLGTASSEFQAVWYTDLKSGNRIRKFFFDNAVTCYVVHSVCGISIHIAMLLKHTLDNF